MLQYRRGNRQMHHQANISFKTQSQIFTFSDLVKLKQQNNNAVTWVLAKKSYWTKKKARSKYNNKRPKIQFLKKRKTIVEVLYNWNLL